MARSEPCARCRRLLAAAGGLRWKRLGKWERTLLRAAAEKGPKNPIVLPVRGLTPAQLVAMRRAVTTLEGAQLIAILRERGKVIERRIYRTDRRGRRRLAARERYAIVTILGNAVAAACRRELRDGGPVRWVEKLPGVRRAILDDCGCLPPAERGGFA